MKFFQIFRWAFGLGIVSTLFSDQVRAAIVNHYQMVDAQTVLEREPTMYCIDSLVDRFRFELHQNDRGFQGYLCEVDFEAKDLTVPDGEIFDGRRIFRFEAETVVERRDHLLDQREYLKRRAPGNPVYYEIPGVVYRTLPGVSRKSEQDEIFQKKNQMRFSDKSVTEAMVNACAIAFMEGASLLCEGRDDFIETLDVGIDLKYELMQLNSRQ